MGNKIVVTVPSFISDGTVHVYKIFEEREVKGKKELFGFFRGQRYDLVSGRIFCEFVALPKDNGALTSGLYSFISKSVATKVASHFRTYKLCVKPMMIPKGAKYYIFNNQIVSDSLIYFNHLR